MGKVIAVDVDLVLVATDKHWIEWLEDLCKVKLQVSDKMCYDLTTYFKDELGSLGMTGMEFWNSPVLYDHMKPIEGSIQALQSLYDSGYTIIPVSRDTGQHGPSKRSWLEKHYPFAEQCVLTKDKHFIRCDYLIEDLIENLSGFKKGDIKMGIILETPYIKRVKGLEVPYIVVNNWSKIPEVLSEMENI